MTWLSLDAPRVRGTGGGGVPPVGRVLDAAVAVLVPRRLLHSADAATVPGMTLHVETELEDDGRWIGAVRELPGVLVYADTQEGAVNAAVALALRVLAERAESGEPVALPITLALVA